MIYWLRFGKFLDSTDKSESQLIAAFLAPMLVAGTWIRLTTLAT
jgi:hypothetical protein